MEHYALFGNPVSHSLSPIIHKWFAEQTEQDMDYRPTLIPRDGFKDAVKAFQAKGGKAINLVLPFKHEAYTLVNQCDEAAKKSKAVNTIIFRGPNEIFGANTDGVGLLRDLKNNHGFSLKDKNILLLGAGGTANGILSDLIKAGPAQITLSNRTHSKAISSLHLLDNDPSTTANKDGTHLEALAFSDLNNQHYDLILNSTSASLDGKVPEISEALIHKNIFIYDMAYSKEPTSFIRWAESHGAVNTTDGLGMLIEQGAELFYLWRGVRPDTKPVMTQLREMLHKTT